MKKRKIKFIWTCSDYMKHEHKYKFTAWLCGRFQYCMTKIKKLFKQKKQQKELSFAEPLNKEDIIAVGRDAEELLKNPAFLLAVSKYEDQLLKQWRNSIPLQTEGRESIWHQVLALNEVKGMLLGMISNMILEKNKIEEKKGEK